MEKATKKRMMTITESMHACMYEENYYSAFSFTFLIKVLQCIVVATVFSRVSIGPLRPHLLGPDSPKLRKETFSDGIRRVLEYFE